MIRLAIIFIVLIIIASYASTSHLNAVKSGKLTLICNDRIVQPNMVLDEIDGTWIFTNGQARNCEVRKWLFAI